MKRSYRIVRHPMYFGYCALWVSWAANGGIGPWLWSALGILLYRAFVEERKMREFVPGYVEYLQKTHGFIPLPRYQSNASRSPKCCLVWLI